LKLVTEKLAARLVPNPCFSFGQFQRFYCLDLAELTDESLRDELLALQPKLWGLPAGHWLRGRVLALETEMIKRRRVTP
jgi:hypothetical protein